MEKQEIRVEVGDFVEVLDHAKNTAWRFGVVEGILELDGIPCAHIGYTVNPLLPYGLRLRAGRPVPLSCLKRIR